MKHFFYITLSFSALTLAASCKPNQTDSDTAAARETPRDQQAPVSDDLVTKMTPADVQEFYDIVKKFYLNRAKTEKLVDNQRFEIEFLTKFGLGLNDNEKLFRFSETMFGLMESGEFQVILHDIPKKKLVSAVPPKGMTSRDLENFLQIVKTEYFKYISGVQHQNFGAQELRFYARMQGLPPTTMPRQGDMLIIAGDLFNRIETGK
jgi:DNA-directed RNA polymerase subunit F